MNTGQLPRTLEQQANPSWPGDHLLYVDAKRAQRADFREADKWSRIGYRRLGRFTSACSNYAQRRFENIYYSLLIVLLLLLSQTPVFANNYGFAGEEQDPATGLANLRARYYDPETGAFLSKDPLGTISTLNGYQYCGNNPVNIVDPTGLFQTGLFVRSVAGLIGNGSIAVGGAILAETGIGAAAAVYGAWQAGGNIGNIINSFSDTPAGPTGPIQTATQVGLIAYSVQPDSLTWQNVDLIGQIGDTGVQTILSAGVDTRLVTMPLGAPGTTAGTLTQVYLPLEEQQTISGMLVRGGTFADQGFTAFDAGTVIGSDILAFSGGATSKVDPILWTTKRRN